MEEWDNKLLVVTARTVSPDSFFLGLLKKYIFKEDIYQRQQVREMQKNPRAIAIIESV
jgi:hypothetical protein